MLTEIVGDIEPDHRILPVPALDSPMEKYAAVSDVPEHIGKVTMAFGLSLAPAPADDAAVKVKAGLAVDLAALIRVYPV